jgi:hypothetical protein
MPGAHQKPLPVKEEVFDFKERYANSRNIGRFIPL